MASYLKLENNDYLLLETGDKIVLQEGTSASFSASLSPSVTRSASLSPSVTRSASLSASLSPSESTSPSLSESLSPSVGYELITRGDDAILPNNADNLETTYTDDEEEDIEKRDNVYVGQTGTLQYMMHQIKVFIGTETFCSVEWEGKSTLAPSDSTVYLQVFNETTSAWETVDSNSTASYDTNFELSGKIPNVTDYVSSDVITFRIYQFATE